MKTRTLPSTVLAVGLLALAALGIGAWVANAAGADAGEGLTASRFSLSIDGFEVGTFAELDLKSGIEPAALESSTKGVVLLPARESPPTITLNRGLNNSMEIWAWHEAALAGDIAAARKNATLTAFNLEGKPVARWLLENAWPAKIEIGGLKAGASEVLMETVTIVGEDLRRVAP